MDVCCLFTSAEEFVVPFVGHKNLRREWTQMGILAWLENREILSINLARLKFWVRQKKTEWDFVYVLMRSDAQNLTSMEPLRRENNTALILLICATLKKILTFSWAAVGTVGVDSVWRTLALSLLLYSLRIGNGDWKNLMKWFLKWLNLFLTKLFLRWR